MLAPAIVPASCMDDACAGEVQSISNANQTVNQVGNSVNKYPSTSTTESVFYKLENYLLNPNHPDGGSKAKWFESALGYTKQNLSDLAKQIVFDPKKAIPTEMTLHGQKYVQWIPITGANGKIINVPFWWIKNLDGVVRLITSIPKSNKK